MDSEDDDVSPLMVSTSGSLSDVSTPIRNQCRLAGIFLISFGVVLVTIGGIGTTWSQIEGKLRYGGIENGQYRKEDWHSDSSDKPKAKPASWRAPAKCETTYRLDQFAKLAHSWCYPRDGAYMPAKLQGLFWFKDMKLDDVGACFSLGTWNSQKRILKLDVATSFVFKDSWRSHQFASQIGSVGMYYEFQFADEGLSYAEISPRGTGAGAINMKVMDLLSKFPLKELKESHGSGDLWERPSYFQGVHVDTYYAWRILDSSMHVNWSRENQMEEQIKKHWDGGLIRYHNDGC